MANLSVPYQPPRSADVVAFFDLAWADRFFYILRFQEPGMIEAEFDANLRDALKRVYFAGSGAAPGAMLPSGPRNTAYLPLLPDPPEGGLSFLSDDDLDVYVSAFRRTGMVGAFNRYRAMPLDGDADADIVGALLDQPSCFIAGEHDFVRNMVPGIDLFKSPGAACSDFRGSTVVQGAGHWVQQEPLEPSTRRSTRSSPDSERPVQRVRRGWQASLGATSTDSNCTANPLHLAAALRAVPLNGRRSVDDLVTSMTPRPPKRATPSIARGGGLDLARCRSTRNQ